MQVLGYGAAQGLSLSLLIRARDVLVGLAGLALGFTLVSRKAARHAQ